MQRLNIVVDEPNAMDTAAVILDSVSGLGNDYFNPLPDFHARPGRCDAEYEDSAGVNITADAANHPGNSSTHCMDAVFTWRRGTLHFLCAPLRMYVSAKT